MSPCSAPPQPTECVALTPPNYAFRNIDTVLHPVSSLLQSPTPPPQPRHAAPSDQDNRNGHDEAESSHGERHGLPPEPLADTCPVERACHETQSAGRIVETCSRPCQKVDVTVPGGGGRTEAVVQGTRSQGPAEIHQPLPTRPGWSNILKRTVHQREHAALGQARGLPCAQVLDRLRQLLGQRRHRHYAGATEQKREREREDEMAERVAGHQGHQGGERDAGRRVYGGGPLDVASTVDGAPRVRAEEQRDREGDEGEGGLRRGQAEELVEVERDLVPGVGGLVSVRESFLSSCLCRRGKKRIRDRGDVPRSRVPPRSCSGS